ncbi:hypothetical protein [Paenibacillus sp. IHBB 10380]|uniref:hypothetical protein n=1 Tax=Paenibacillus sp. IHBB 10380 TaxID=1566358 RepID=UPI0005CFADB2|nr:hypothetical protein [Paenibacillus sp. IHBB 10380]AJS58645.1 hypothetical protein UB51_09265 [Paenibacillus sp. IHBB 10380]
MRRHGVLLKLFVVTSELILIIFSLVTIAEGLFFERFYRSAKIDELERNMSQLGRQYGGVYLNEIEAARLLGHFMNHNNASVAILNKQFERMSLDPYFIRLQTESTIITIQISSDGTMTQDIPTGLSTGYLLVVDGIFIG